MSKRFKVNILGIKFSFKLPCSDKGEIIGINNSVKTDKNINAKIKINGNNNIVDITKADIKGKAPVDIKINIKGDNNKIFIKDIRTAKLNIDIGNYTGVNNVNVEILDNLACVSAKILAYQSNVPVKIGKNCLFSKDITIRSGELPHTVYDKDTFEDFDKSNGVIIGNHVWIGENAYILKNAKIPNDSIVGTMSVVTKEFTEPNIVIAGNPAKLCKRNVVWDESYLNRPNPQ